MVEKNRFFSLPSPCAVFPSLFTLRLRYYLGDWNRLKKVLLSNLDMSEACTTRLKNEMITFSSSFSSFPLSRSFIHFQSYKSISDKSGIFPDLASTTSLMFGRGSFSSVDAPSIADEVELGK